MTVTVSSSFSTQGFSLVCDATGVIERLVRDDLGVMAQTTPPRMLHELLDSASWSKAQEFLQTIVQKGAAFNWELNTRLELSVESLFFAGGAVRDAILICGVRAPWRLEEFCNELLRINNEQTNAARTAFKDQSQALARQRDAADAFDELTRLNNEMATLQRELAKRNAELERLNEEKNRAIGVVAHDLRNPLQTIHLSSEVLLRGAVGPLDETQRQVIETVQASSRYMLKLVNDILDVAAIEAGKLRLDLEAVDLAALVNDVAHQNRTIGRTQQVELLCDTTGLQGVVIQGDAVKLRQVLNNLTHNALKFSPAGDVVTVAGACHDGYAAITVRDHGPGVPHTELERLFRPFETSNAPQRSGRSGAGLGLAIVNRIVTGHGGKIEVQSEPGRGAAFTVRLPLASPPH